MKAELLFGLVILASMVQSAQAVEIHPAKENAKLNIIGDSLGKTVKDTAVTQIPSVDSVKNNSKQSRKTFVSDQEKLVATGYGMIKKENLTGAVAGLDGNSLSGTAGFGIEKTLQGKVAGLSVIRTSASPGAQSQLKLYGIGAITTSDPLYVVDGMVISSGDIRFLNPNDIELITILKDATTAAIYGIRGLHGVILINTKKAKNEPSSDRGVGIEYSSFFGANSPWKTPNMCTAAEWKMLRMEAITNSGDTTGLGLISSYSPQGTNWWKETTRRNAFIQYHDVSLRKGSENTQINVSGSYCGEEGIENGSDNRRVNLHGQAENKMTGWLTLGLNSFYSNAILHPIEGNNFIPFYNRWGNNLNLILPMPDVTTDYLTGQIDKKIVIADIHATITIADIITFVSLVGFDLDYLDTSHIEPKYFISSEADAINSSDIIKSPTNKSTSWSTENNLTFDKTFAEDHNVKVLAGVSTEDNKSKFVSNPNADTFSNNVILQYPHTTVATPQSVNGFASGNTLRSFLGRLSYEYASKYLATLSVRRDWSSWFEPDKRWGNSPAVAVAWKVSEEKFMEKCTFLQLFKLRAGYGLFAKQEPGSNASINAATFGLNYSIPEPISLGYFHDQTMADNPTWERAASSTVGMDLSALQGKLEISGNYSRNFTEGTIPRSPDLSYATLQKNAMTIEIANTGFEAFASYSENIHGFNGQLSANISHYANRVVKLGDQTGTNSAISSGLFRSRYISRTAVGHSVGEFYGYKTNGLFQTQAECDSAKKSQPNVKPGDVRYIDADSDGKWDKEYIGNPNPLFTYGASLHVGREGKYGGIDIDLCMHGSFGNKIFNAARIYTNTSTAYYNEDRRMLNRWTGPGSTNDASLPRMNALDANNTDQISDVYVEDGSYLRLKDLQIGYTLPKNLFGIHNRIRIYIGAQNLVTITGYSGLDPELGLDSNSGWDPLEIGIDRGTYPQNRTVYSGVTVCF